MFWNFDKVIVSRNDALPIDWQGMSCSRRVFVEIGFGNGEFLEYLARAYPNVLSVGLEVSQWCAGKGARRILAAGHDNARIIHGDARFLLRHAFAPESVERVYMNFPCPWPKTRHASRRVASPAFAKLMEYLLTPGGTFELATDVEWYAQATADVFAADGMFCAEPLVKNPVRPYVTKYERKWRAMGKDTWGLTVRKTASMPVRPAKEEEWPMECEAEGKKSVKDVLAAMRGREGTGSGGSGHWVVRDSFESETGAGLLLVITSDEGFEQHFYLKVLRNPRGVTIKVDSVGHPYRTPAMRAVLREALAAAQ